MAGAWEHTGQPGSVAPAGFGSRAGCRASGFPNRPGHGSPAESPARWHFTGSAEQGRDFPDRGVRLCRWMRRAAWPKQEPCPLPAAVGSGCAYVGDGGRLSPKSQVLAPEEQMRAQEERGAEDLILRQLSWYGVFRAALGSLHRRQTIALPGFHWQKCKP